MDVSVTIGQDEEGDNMKTFFEVAFEVLGCVVLVIGMITIFVGAVLQESYRHLIDNDRDYLINALMEDLECRR